MERRVRDSATFCKHRLCSIVFQRVLLCYNLLYSVLLASLVMYGATPSFANISIVPSVLSWMRAMLTLTFACTNAHDPPGTAGGGSGGGGLGLDQERGLMVITRETTVDCNVKDHTLFVMSLPPHCTSPCLHTCPPPPPSPTTHMRTEAQAYHQHIHLYDDDHDDHDDDHPTHYCHHHHRKHFCICRRTHVHTRSLIPPPPLPHTHTHTLAQVHIHGQSVCVVDSRHRTSRTGLG
jgi:hypothetical protein